MAAIIPDLLISHMEDLRLQSANLERRLEKERKRLQRHQDHLRNHRLPVHNQQQQQQQQQFDESFSEDSRNNTQENLLSDRGESQSRANSGRGRSRKVSSGTAKDDKNLIDSDGEVNAGINCGGKVTSSSPIRINHKQTKNELVSSSGSYDSNNEEEVFKKPMKPSISSGSASSCAKQLNFNSRGYTNGRKFSQVEGEIRRTINVKRTNSWCVFVFLFFLFFLQGVDPVVVV